MLSNECGTLEVNCSDVMEPDAESKLDNLEEPVKTTYTVEEVADMLGICKTSAYKVIKSGVFQYIKAGRVYRVSKISFDKWLNGESS